MSQAKNLCKLHLNQPSMDQYQPDKFQFFYFKCAALALFLMSMFPWFIWNLPIILVDAPFFLIFFGFAIFNRQAFAIQREQILPNILLVLSFLLYAKGFSLFGIIEQILILIACLLSINLREHLKVQLFDFITNKFGFLMFISLGYYLLFLAGIPLPSSTIGVTKIGYSGINYFLFTVPESMLHSMRFRGIFAEPGHLTMGIIMILYANKFNLKNKWVLVLLITELFTLSLAGYISIVISLVIFSFSKQVNPMYPRVSLLIIVLAASIGFSKIRDDSVLYSFLVARLEFDDSKGTIAGYNRTDENLDYIFGNFIKSNSKWFGLKMEDSSVIIDGYAGYKVFLIRFGLISAVFVTLFYILLSIPYRQYEVYGFLILLVLLLYQNAYPFWFCVVFGYVFGIAKLKQEKLVEGFHS